MMLQLSDYRDAIKLDEKFEAPVDDERSTHDLLITALAGLKSKNHTGETAAHLSTNEGLERWLHTELSEREPGDLDPITSRAINTLLWRRMADRGRVEANNLRRVVDLIPDSDYVHLQRVSLYRGDAQQLVVDALVNSAMPDLRGCPVPLDHCIDSEVHAQAGPWLKNDTAKIMDMQGTGVEEPGNAKITRGYRLPAKYVVHTVAPKVEGEVSEENRQELYNCYKNSLDLAAEKGDIDTIAFPTIATGIGGFPMEEAADIALHAVNDWFDHHQGGLGLVVFIVRDDHDSNVYQNALEQWVED